MNSNWAFVCDANTSLLDAIKNEYSFNDIDWMAFRIHARVLSIYFISLFGVFFFFFGQLHARSMFDVSINCNKIVQFVSSPFNSVYFCRMTAYCSIYTINIDDSFLQRVFREESIDEFLVADYFHVPPQVWVNVNINYRFNLIDFSEHV